jgi:lipopolysaccharide/colanic/teichoic acid biosynthesis glycosyltransferase
MNTSPITREEMDFLLEKKKCSMVFIRVFDVIASLSGICVLSPLLLLGGLAVKISSKGPVFYSQERVGRHQKPFFIHKFRTMVEGADKMGTLVTVSDDERVTKIGKILRRTKLDELPQLFNVLVGEMALVGPRPEVKKFVDYYDENALQLLRLRPGVTDLASIEYRSESELLDAADDPEKVYIEEIMPEKHALNYAYIREIGFWNNIKVLFLTLRKLIK